MKEKELIRALTEEELAGLAGGYVKINDAESSIEGTVRSIGAIYTELTMPDNRRISIPNSSLTNTPIVNFSREGTRRQDLIYSVSYTADIESVFSVLQNLADSEPRILRDPAPKVYLSEHGQSSLNFLGGTDGIYSIRGYAPQKY